MPDNVQEDILLSKDVFPTRLKSREIRILWSDGMKKQSLFSARTTSREYLERVKELLADAQTGMGLTKDGLPISQGQDRTRMLMREKLAELGLLERDEKGEIEERMTNLGSSMRLDLIIETNTEFAHSSAQKMTASDPLQQILRPAWELVRNQPVNVARNWAERWYECAEICGWQGVARNTTRMVALKDSPIWELLGNHFLDSIGCDQPPFCWGSKMGWKTVTRNECKELGLIEDGNKS